MIWKLLTNALSLFYMAAYTQASMPTRKIKGPNNHRFEFLKWNNQTVVLDSYHHLYIMIIDSHLNRTEMQTSYLLGKSLLANINDTRLKHKSNQFVCIVTLYMYYIMQPSSCNSLCFADPRDDCCMHTPNRYEPLTQWRFNVRPSSSTLAQH